VERHIGFIREWCDLHKRVGGSSLMTSVPSWWMQGPFGTAHTLFHRRRWRCVHNRDAKMKVYCCQKHTYVCTEEDKRWSEATCSLDQLLKGC